MRNEKRAILVEIDPNTETCYVRVKGEHRWSALYEIGANARKASAQLTKVKECVEQTILRVARRLKW